MRSWKTNIGDNDCTHPPQSRNSNEGGFHEAGSNSHQLTGCTRSSKFNPELAFSNEPSGPIFPTLNFGPFPSSFPSDLMKPNHANDAPGFSTPVKRRIVNRGAPRFSPYLLDSRPRQRSLTNNIPGDSFSVPLPLPVTNLDTQSITPDIVNELDPNRDELARTVGIGIDIVSKLTPS
ncbi:hypothetical protein LXL04_028623 [Taraxacum kok-saghyz]